MGRLVYGPHAQRDIAEHIRYLRGHGQVERLRRFDEALTALELTLTQFPKAGRELTQGASATLRRIGLRRIPLFVWYLYEPEREEVTIVRLFHVKQETPEPRLR